jgi:hypothetical protein
MSDLAVPLLTTSPPFGRTRCGEGGKDSTLDVAEAIGEYAGSNRDALNSEADARLAQRTERATRLESAIARVIAEGKVCTCDMGGKACTLEVAKAIANYATS